jgi:hypothetical protein
LEKRAIFAILGVSEEARYRQMRSYWGKTAICGGVGHAFFHLDLKENNEEQCLDFACFAKAPAPPGFQIVDWAGRTPAPSGLKRHFIDSFRCEGVGKNIGRSSFSDHEVSLQSL